MHALNEQIVYFASSSPTAIGRIGSKFKLNETDPIDYNILKMTAEGIEWGFFGREEFFNRKE